MASSTSKHYDDPAPPAKHTEIAPAAETAPPRDPMNTLETIAEEQRRRSDEYVAGLAAPPPEQQKVAPPFEEPHKSDKKK